MSEKLTVEELAQELNVTTRTIRNYLKEGKLHGTKIGGQWRFSQEDLYAFIGHNDDNFQAKNGVIYHFLEEPEEKFAAVTVLDFPINELNNLPQLIQQILDYFNEVYEGGNRLFQYYRIEEKIARFTLSGPTPYVLSFSQKIYEFAENQRLTKKEPNQ